MRYVVTGSNRGIGLEFVRQLVERGDSVVAAVRDPGHSTELSALARRFPDAIHIHPCDVADDSSVAAFGKALAGTAVDVLINNAGVMGAGSAFARLEPGRVLETLNVNAVGALRVTQAVLPSIRAGKGRKLIHITSGLGSIGDNRSGGYYDYRMSKAALNMLAKTLAEELGREGIVSVALQPGWVQTDMGGRGAPTPVQDSVRGMLKVIDGAGAAESGRFLGWDGNETEW